MQTILSLVNFNVDCDDYPEINASDIKKEHWDSNVRSISFPTSGWIIIDPENDRIINYTGGRGRLMDEVKCFTRKFGFEPVVAVVIADDNAIAA